MGKTRQKTHSEKEHLLGEINELKKENRRLKRENKSLLKRAHMYEDVIDSVVEKDEEQKDVQCKSCYKGIITTYDFKYIIVSTCNYCDYQKNTKPGGKK